MSARWQWLRSIEDTDIIESKETADKDVIAFRVFAVDPPGESKQQLMEHPRQELAIGTLTLNHAHLVNAIRRPPMHRRIHISKRPLIRRDLSIGMHEPL